MRSKVKIKSCGVAHLRKEPDIFKAIHFGLHFSGVQSLIFISKVKVDLRGQVWPWRSKVIWQKSAVFDHRTLHMFYGSYFKFSINFEHSFWPQRPNLTSEAKKNTHNLVKIWNNSNHQTYVKLCDQRQHFFVRWPLTPKVKLDLWGQPWPLRSKLNFELL